MLAKDVGELCLYNAVETFTIGRTPSTDCALPSSIVIWEQHASAESAGYEPVDLETSGRGSEFTFR
jgi:hypothetical protein